MDASTNTTLPLDYHRRNEEKEDDIQVSSSERMFLIIGVVVALIILQIIGCLICYKDKWLAKRNMKKNQQEDTSPNPASNRPIEITEILTSARQPKKGKVPPEDANGEEAAAALLPQKEESEGDLKDVKTEEPAVIEVHESGEATEPTQSVEESKKGQEK